MAPASTEAQNGSVRSVVLDHRSDPIQPVTTNKGNSASLTEAHHQSNVTSGTAPANNVQLHLPSSSTSMLTRWVYETCKSELTWAENWHRKH
ncbi:hypothetical protein DL546_003799 [Coniochaeta pulveracea]|uniref:Uncharacterized protein n=1 Tax=Coniochaeta pulveracea TaxID=177199 RepID=A0A420YA89_9PEZI|nr:hypothetical protein DL546_003799 [Coniochaeta pulveracea]